MAAIYLLLAAYTHSKWDTELFALIKISNDAILRLQERSSLQKDLYEKRELLSISVSNDLGRFYADTGQLPAICFNENALKPGIYSFDEDFISNLSKPSLIESGQMSFWTNRILFEASGKHPGEKYWCETTIEFILEEFKKLGNTNQ